MVSRIVSLRLTSGYIIALINTLTSHPHPDQSSLNELPCPDDLPSLSSSSPPPPLPPRATLPSLSSAGNPASATAAFSRTKSPQSVCSRREHRASLGSTSPPAAGHARQGTRAQMARTAFHAEQAHTLHPARSNVRYVHTERSRAVSTASVFLPNPLID
jgi:hypothetical protein